MNNASQTAAECFSAMRLGRQRPGGSRRTDVCSNTGRSATKTTDLGCFNSHRGGMTGGGFLGRRRRDDRPPRAHQRSSASARIWSAPSTKTARPEQNKDDISGFLPDGGTGAVGDDKTQPGAPPLPPNPDNLETSIKQKEIHTVIS